MSLTKQELINLINNDFGKDLNKPFSSRMLRFLISERIVDRPDGETFSARYNQKHYDQIKKYYQLKDIGHTVKQIAKINNNFIEDLSIEIIPGITLLVSHDVDLNSLDTKDISKKIKNIVNDLKTGENS